MNQAPTTACQDALTRLSKSRLALVQALVTSDAEQAGSSSSGVGLLGSLLASSPLVAMAMQVLNKAPGDKSSAPFSLGGVLQGLSLGVMPLVRRHPLISVLAGLAVGAIIIHQRKRVWALARWYLS